MAEIEFQSNHKKKQHQPNLAKYFHNNRHQPLWHPMHVGRIEEGKVDLGRQPTKKRWPKEQTRDDLSNDFGLSNASGEHSHDACRGNNETHLQQQKQKYLLNFNRFYINQHGEASSGCYRVREDFQRHLTPQSMRSIRMRANAPIDVHEQPPKGLPTVAEGGRQQV